MSSTASSLLRGGSSNSSSNNSLQTSDGSPVQLGQIDGSRPSLASSISAASPGGEIYRRHTPLSPDRNKPSAFSLPQPILDSSPIKSTALNPTNPSSDRVNASLPLFTSRAARHASLGGQPDMSVRALLARHQYLLRTMAILVVLCAIYLYFAISMDQEGMSCQGLRGAVLAECREQLKAKRLANRKGRGGDGAGISGLKRSGGLREGRVGGEGGEGGENGEKGKGGEGGDRGGGQIGHVRAIQTEEQERYAGSYQAAGAGGRGLSERQGDKRDDEREDGSKEA
ncbi:hypothetical protein CLOM_g22260 [Closterium sp. NIES-68]|nr:hypothetical protein CLOM_g22260 [Closterium sp. NIES-68]GJP85354.1 hypothetical protein CLOP_g15455 [Closterium sp. NIES-67]